MNLLSAYFKYMRDPACAVRDAFSVRRTGWGVAGYACAALCMVLYFNVGDGISPAALFTKFMILFAAELVIGYFAASLSGLYLDFSGVKASPSQLFALIGTAGFIKGVLAAFAIIKTAVPALAFLGGLVWLAVLLCQLFYLINNLKRLYDISGGKAFIALLFAVVPPVAAGLVLGACFVWMLVLVF